MNKDFNQKHYGKGARVSSNAEWNDLTNAVTKINAGKVSSVGNYADKYGSNVVSDSFFFPHTAELSGDYQTAIIGWDREESWYPYIDSLSLQNFQAKLRVEKINGTWEITEVDKFSTLTPVVWTEKTSVQPLKPADPNNGVIVGYAWDLAPQGVLPIKNSVNDFFITIKWEADEIYEEPVAPNLAGTFTVEYKEENPENTGPRIYEGSTGYSLQSVINTGLQNSSLSGEIGPITLTADETFNDYIIQIPVARYDWNPEQTQLVRCIQLLFASSFGGALLGPNSKRTEFRHPFKGYVSGTFDDGYSIVIAPDRPNDTYEFKDIITITDPNTEKQNHFSIVKDYVEKVAINEDSYVYYDIVLSGDDKWYATLAKTPEWPPNDGPDHLYKVIGYANLSGESCFWGQEMFECPTEQIPDVRGDFYPTYEQGYLRLTSGSVNCYDNIYADVAGGKFDLNTPQYIWVEIDSSESSSTPSVTVKGTLQTGAKPDMYQPLAGDYYGGARFSYIIGEIVGGKRYIPYHKGSLDIDNTLLQASMDPDYCDEKNCPRVMEFHDDQVTLVGDSSNPTLLDAKFFNLRVRGGGVLSMIETNPVKFYGLTDAAVDVLAAADGVDGSDFGEGSFTISGSTVDYEWDHGLVQRYDVTTSEILTVNAGTGIRIDYAAGAATINAAVSGITGLTQDTNDQLIIVDGTDGTTWGEGSMSVSGTAFDRAFDNGIAQRCDINTGNIFSILAGENIRIDYAAGAATINAPPSGTIQSLSGDFTEITVVTDVQLLSGGTLQKKTRSVFVYNPGAESGWTDAGSLATTTCPT